MGVSNRFGKLADSEVKSDDDMTEERFLEAYKKKEYPKPSVTADIAVFCRIGAETSVLLVRRGKHPFRGCWALPGGFVNPDEDVKDAALRELEEETGVSGVQVELFGIYGAPGRDPRGWTVSGGFCAMLDGNAAAIAHAGDDAADAKWCLVSETTEGDPGNRNCIHVLSIRCSDEETITVRYSVEPQRFGAPRAAISETSGFAFDHAQLIVDAYLKAMLSAN